MTENFLVKVLTSEGILMFESSLFEKINTNKLSNKGECLTKFDFNNIEQWNFYTKKLTKLKSLLLDTYIKKDTKLANAESPYSIARGEALVYMQNIMDYICDLANINKFQIDKRAINYSLNFISVKRKISSGSERTVHLFIDFIVSPQVIFESVLYCKINKIDMKTLKPNEEIEIYKHISNSSKDNISEQVFQNVREIDLICDNEPVLIYVYYKTISCQFKNHNLENVTALVNCENRFDPIKINICFCKECSRYFIQETALNQYQNKYGVIIFRHLYDERYYEDKIIDDDRYMYYKSHSELWLYGYNVQQGKLTKEERKKLLTFLITTNLLSKNDVIQSLIQNIDEFKNRERYGEAIAKWKEDLIYIQNFNIDEQRLVTGKLVR